jgi:ATP dependent DNA ligase domain
LKFSVIGRLEEGRASHPRTQSQCKPGDCNGFSKNSAGTTCSLNVDIQAALKSNASFIEPMLCLSTSSLPEREQWQYELKLDGYRALAFNTEGKVDLRSRNNKDFATRYPVIAHALQKIPDETTLDGELVAFDDSGRPSFNKLQNYGSSNVPSSFTHSICSCSQAATLGRSRLKNGASYCGRQFRHD